MSTNPLSFYQERAIDTIYLISWNVDGSCTLSGKPDWDWLVSTDADAVVLQGTKAEPSQIAEERHSSEGWNAEWPTMQIKKGYPDIMVFSC